MNWKRMALIVAAVVVYAVAIFSALILLPFADTPAWFKLLIGKSSYAGLAWMKIRHTAIVGLVAGVVAFFLVSGDRRGALFNALSIGALTVAAAIVLRLAMVSGAPATLLEITDYLVIGGAVPLLTAVSLKVSAPGSAPR